MSTFRSFKTTAFESHTVLAFYFLCSLSVTRFYEVASEDCFKILVYDGSVLLRSLVWNLMSHWWGQQKPADPEQVDLPEVLRGGSGVLCRLGDQRAVPVVARIEAGLGDRRLGLRQPRLGATLLSEVPLGTGVPVCSPRLSGAG